MLNIIETWSRDHRNFEYLLDVLEAEVNSVLDDQAPRYDLMLDILYYMTHYPDIFHHPKEDLVSARVKELDVGAGIVVDELARQHVVLRESGAELHDLLQQILNGAMLKRESIEAPARTYITHFRKHMQKEEADVFPLMQTRLSEEDWAAIEKAAPFKEDPLFGNGPLAGQYEVLHRQIRRVTEYVGLA